MKINTIDLFLWVIGGACVCALPIAIYFNEEIEKPKEFVDMAFVISDGKSCVNVKPKIVDGTYYIELN